MNLTIDETEKKGILALDGSLTIIRATEIKNSLIDAMKKVQSLEVDISGAEDFDLSFLQLLYSAHKTSLGVKKNFSISAGYPEVFELLIKDAGLPQPEFFLKDELLRSINA
ncbi:MAG: hypothetical protein WCJ01_05370 [Ignavibacteria bacterium]